MHSLITVFACMHFTNNSTWTNFSTTWNYAYPNLENTCNKFFEIFKSWHSSSLEVPCGKQFLRVLIFPIFAVFPAICKNKFPQIKIIAHTFPVKINSRVNILQLKFTTQKYSTTKSCLFNHNLSLSFRNNEILVYYLKMCISIARIVLNKYENIINAGYCVLSKNSKN